MNQPLRLTPQRNADADWDQFDSDAYHFRNYANVLQPDLYLTRWTAAAFATWNGSGPVVDIGTGPSLLPLLCALSSATALAAWEYSQSNVTWLLRTLEQPVMPHGWRRFWNLIEETQAGSLEVDDAWRAFREKTTIHQGSIFELPRSKWAAATMFFCAESLTEDVDEFELACRCFARSVVPDGLMVAAFMENSKGYEVNGKTFPAVPVDRAAVLKAFDGLAHIVDVRRIDAKEYGVRLGYTGMIYIEARATTLAGS
jgi:NNMT/PNMT/TEMT family